MSRARRRSPGARRPTPEVRLIDACWNGRVSTRLQRLSRALADLPDESDVLPPPAAVLRQQGWATRTIIDVLATTGDDMTPEQIRQAIQSKSGVLLGQSTIMAALRKSRAAKRGDIVRVRPSYYRYAA